MNEYKLADWYLGLTDDQKVVFETRLGSLCEDREPKIDQIQIAWKEAVGEV